MPTFSVNTTRCCAMLELSNISALSTSKAVIEAAAKGVNEIGISPGGSERPFIIFTGVVGMRHKKWDTSYHADRDDDYGEDLANYIRANGLGEIYDQIPEKRNYSGNMVKVWMWCPNYEELFKFLPPAALQAEAGRTTGVAGADICAPYTTLSSLTSY